ncbi:MAG: RagB/SusD family nutrient uptake outer membrane protein [Niabella sp.]
MSFEKFLYKRKTRNCWGMVLLMISFASCSKMLDVDPAKYVIQSDNLYSTEAGVNKALSGVYAIMADNHFYGSYLQGLMGLEADEGYCRYDPYNTTVALYNASSSDYLIHDYWKIVYEGINRANEVLYYIDEADISEEKIKKTRGEALFLRAYYYFMLVNKFGGVPLILDPTRSGAAEVVQVARASMKEVYERILADMEEASELVADVTEVESAGRVSKSAVWGILARVCLYMAGAPLNDKSKYAEAANWASKVISSGHHQLNPSYQQVFINYAQDLYDIKESIWEVEFYGNGSGIYSNTHGMVGRNNGIWNLNDPVIGQAIGIVRTTQWLYNLYAPNDVRRDWVIAPYTYVGNPGVKTASTGTIYNRYCGKYRREYETLLPKNTAATPQNAPLLRYSDVLLMYAEAVNEMNTGPSGEAFEALNKVRRRGMGLDPDTPDASADIAGLSYYDFQQEIRDERARELCFEGLRKNDIVRWNIFLASMKTRLLEVPAGTAAQLIAAKAYYTNASERDILWPIPSAEMNLNKKLIQNTGW